MAECLRVHKQAFAILSKQYGPSALSLKLFYYIYVLCLLHAIFVVWIPDPLLANTCTCTFCFFGQLAKTLHLLKVHNHTLHTCRVVMNTAL